MPIAHGATDNLNTMDGKNVLGQIDPNRDNPHGMSLWQFECDVEIPSWHSLTLAASAAASSWISVIADLLYFRSVDSAYDATHLANRPSAREYQYRHLYSNSARIVYGRTPCIYARLVSNFMVERNEVRMVERVRWT